MTTTSLLVYGGYLILNGVLLTTLPALTLSIIGLEFSGDPWIRVVGILAIEIGFYFVYAARRELVGFFAPSVYGRIWVAAGFTGLVVFGIAPVQLLLFSLVDAMSALWTYWGMITFRRDHL